jgi:peroxiredoxin
MSALRYGQAAPAFSLPSSSGSTVSLADFRGQEVVLAFYCYDWGGI